MRAIYMNDSDFDLCVRRSGLRKFSSWAVRLLLAAATDEPILGATYGGMCGHKGCGAVGAKVFNKASRLYFCKDCAALSFQPWLYEDRSEIAAASTPNEVRRALVKAVLNAAKALEEHDVREEWLGRQVSIS